MTERFWQVFTFLMTRMDEDHDEERGDVPGWVLITLMTAGLVVAIWTVAGPALETAFKTAITKVTSIL